MTPSSSTTQLPQMSSAPMPSRLTTAWIKSPKLSLCMIVRDSSRTLAAALESVRPWVDEIIVVDTGSRDNTPQIAGQHGARVFCFPWCDDFAKARNESLRRARGQWIFWMDSDDTIDDVNGRKLRELAAQSPDDGPMGYVMQVHCPSPNADGEADVTIVDHVKMFRNRPELRFEGRIHEQILPAIRRLNGETAWTDVFVVHSGSDHSLEGRSRKQERDLRLLDLDLQDRPNHPFVLFNLGMTYGDMQRHDEAIVALRHCLNVSSPCESHVRKAYALLACSLMQLERTEEAWQVCQTALGQFPSDPELQFRLGLAAHRLGRLKTAAAAYEAALADREDRCFSSRDMGITGYKARHNLAIVYTEQDRYDLAELQWRQVIAEIPGYRPGWRGLREALTQQGKFAHLEADIERIPAIPSLEAEAAIWQIEITRTRNDFSATWEAVERTMQRFPEDIEILQTGCRFLFDRGPAELAEKSLLNLCRHMPHDGAAHHNLGTLYWRMGRLAEAAAAYQRSLAVRPDSSVTREAWEQLTHQRRQSEHPIPSSTVGLGA